MEKDLTKEYLDEIFTYDGKSGKLFWKIRKSIRNTVGQEVGKLSDTGYKVVSIDYCRYRVHRIIWFMNYGKWPNEIDHINHNRTDNRLENLRDVGRKINGKNQSLSKNNKSGYSGVYWSKREQKWKVEIKVDFKKICLGTFKNLKDAVTVRKQAEIDYGFHKNHGRKGTAVQSK